MPDTLYQEFEDPTEAFAREPRAFCYDLAIGLINQAKAEATLSWYTQTESVKAIILLLYCWNFAARETKRLTFDSVRNVLSTNEQNLRLLEQYTLLTFDETSELPIQTVFSQFREAFGQTGATKALSLLNPRLFLMWDTRIRARLRRELVRGLDNGQTEDQYILFLRKVRDYAAQYNFQQRLAPNAILAKKIDEYHYVRIVMAQSVLHVRDTA
ncbi:MAG: hypothetical protein WEF53_03995 [Bacteroidota bacterium]